MKTKAIILLSGTGIRFGLSYPKQFLKLKGTPLFAYSLSAFIKNEQISEIVLVVNEHHIKEVEHYLVKNKVPENIKIVTGGDTRQKSSYMGISSLTGSDSKVLIHDAARPFVSQEVINNCILRLDSYQAVSTVIPVTDTLYLKDEVDKIIDIPLRNYYVRAQTPQGFHSGIILEAHEKAIQHGFINAPDDCFLVKKYSNIEISLITGDIYNIKITYPDDIAFAETIIDNYYEH